MTTNPATVFVRALRWLASAAVTLRVFVPWARRCAVCGSKVTLAYMVLSFTNDRGCVVRFPLCLRCGEKVPEAAALLQAQEHLKHELAVKLAGCTRRPEVDAIIRETLAQMRLQTNVPSYKVKDLGNGFEVQWLLP